MKPIYVYPLLILGAAIMLYPSILIDVNMRLAYWENRTDYPNIDPRIMYTFSLFILAAIATVAGIVEVFRGWVFQLKRLMWWQALIVGGSYAIFFSGLALRHYLEPNMAFYVAVFAAVIINPISTYYVFNGFSKNAA